MSNVPKCATKQVLNHSESMVCLPKEIELSPPRGPSIVTRGVQVTSAPVIYKSLY